MSFNVKTIKPGNGSKPPQGAKVSVHYVGTLTSGKKFDSSRDRGEPFVFTLGKKEVIRGWDEGVAQMSVGELAIITCPGNYAYGQQGYPGLIPPNATLIFETKELSNLLASKMIELAPKLRNYLLAHHPYTQCFEYIRPQFDTRGEDECLRPDSRMLSRVLEDNSPSSNKTKQQKERRKSVREWRVMSRVRRARFAGRPKRPMNPYTLFAQLQSQYVRNEYPALPAAYVMQICAKRYQQLTPEQRRPFVEKYEAGRREYMLQREAFFQKNPRADYRVNN